MPKNDNQTHIYKVLTEYRRIVLENDNLIKSLDYLKRLTEKSPSQYYRIDELEKTIIPSAIEREQDAKKEIDKYIERAKSNPLFSPFSLSIIELRYFSALEWPEVAAAIFQTTWSESTKSEKARYLNKIYKQHSRTLSVIEKALP